MKRLVILFLLSLLGIVLLQVLGMFFFGTIPHEYKTGVAITVIIIELLLYLLMLYTLVLSFKHRGNIWVKLFKFINTIVVLFLTIVFLGFGVSLSGTLVNAHKYFNKKELNVIPETAVKANIYPMVDYNGMSKDFILSLRLGNLDSNVSQWLDYKPNDEVWAKMKDKSEWLGFNCSICYDTKTDCSRRLKGVSSMSRLINNPMMLVAPILIATYHLDESLPVCSDKGLKLLPQNIYVDNVNNKIIIVYSGSRALTKCHYLQLSGLNARDFGLNWGKVSDSQNIMFPYKNNISQRVYKFKDEIAYAEFSKNSDKKCNTYAGIDDRVIFEVTSYPANIELKLWFEKPLFTFMDSDFNVEIRFVED